MRNKKNSNFSEMINKIKNSENITNRIITNVNMLINPKKFENSNITRFYKNFYGAKRSDAYNKSSIKPSKSVELIDLMRLNKNAGKAMKGIGGVYFDNTYEKNQGAKKDLNKLVYQNKKGISDFILNKRDYNAHINKNRLNYFMGKTFYRPGEKVFEGTKEFSKKTVMINFKKVIPNVTEGKNFIDTKGNFKAGGNGGFNQGTDRKIIGGNIFREDRRSVNQTQKRGIGGNIFKDMKGAFGVGFKRRAKMGMPGDVSTKLLNGGGKNIFDFSSLPFRIERGENIGKDFKGFKFKEKIFSKNGDKNISEKTGGGINISPNINVEITPKNSLRDFNKIWEEIGGRLMDEINSSVSGYH